MPVTNPSSAVAGREIVEEGVTGLLVDPHSPEEIAGALARLLIDRDFAHRLGTQGRSRVVREFQWAQVGERVPSVLRSVQAEGAIRDVHRPQP